MGLKPKTRRDVKLQEIFQHIGNCQYELVMSEELVDLPTPADIEAVYAKLEEARELLRKVK